MPVMPLPSPRSSASLSSQSYEYSTPIVPVMPVPYVSSGFGFEFTPFIPINTNLLLIGSILIKLLKLS
jgi:hypothetical protein